MTSNQEFAIRLFNTTTTNPILIDTHFTATGEPRIRPLTKVGHLIQAAKTTLSPLLDSVSLAHLTLKLPDGTALAGNKLLSTIDAGSWNWDRPLVIESNTPAQFVTGPTGLTFSVRKTANFDIYYPVDLDENVVTSLSWLSILMEQSDFLNTFNLRIRVIAPKEYNNNIRSYADKDRFAGPEYGWYDASIAPDTIYINQNYYRIHDSTNLQHLQFLAIVTAIHELQHFLVHHLELESPNQPIPSMQPPETESGDYWEFHNLGGRLGIVSRKETPEDFIGLYLIGLDEMNREFHTMVSDGFIDAVLQDVSSGKNAFPKRLGHIEPIPASYIKSKILHKCNDVDDNRGNHDLKLNEGFLKPVRKPDKKPYVK